MEPVSLSPAASQPLPNWVPEAARLYLDHARGGRSLRTLAAEHGCAPSTVMRAVRRIEARRDDPLIDDAMDRLHREVAEQQDPEEGTDTMSAMPMRAALIDDDTLTREARRVLRRLCEGDAVLVVGQGMDQAVVLREVEPAPIRTATLPRAVAQAFVMKDWVSCFKAGRVTRYRITVAGRAALRRMLADKLEAKTAARGMAERGSPFLHQQADIAEVVRHSGAQTERLTVNLAESPLGVLARRKDRDGKVFLSPELVLAGETLRGDFEAAQMGPRVGQDWERFLTAGARGQMSDGMGGGSQAARERVSVALRELGPGLGDVVLRVCCFLEGLEAAEKRMGWAARSGKVVLRIALQRLQRHYVEAGRL